MLSSSAFNAFLKTLEEPPAHAIFILATTEKHKIIPTILSRCQIFDFNRIRIEDIVSRLMYVAKEEGIKAEEEALHVIGQKADGAMRDALSIFDQIASLSGKAITYSDVISNLNVLDYEYYFRTIDSALLGDISSVLVTFNEILDKGFDGHNFISGLNSHLRDLLVCKDEVTVKLLEASPAIKQRYLQQTSRCPVDFLFRALEAGNACDLNYKNTKNPRLIVELTLIKICRLLNENGEEPEKKKPESIITRKTEKKTAGTGSSDSINSVQSQPAAESFSSKHEPRIDKPVKSFSIKDILSEGNPGKESHDEKPNELINNDPGIVKEELTPESLTKSWNEFIGQLNGDGTRIVSMFKSVQPELENGNIISIHLHNATQKDIFVLNYKAKLVSHLERKFDVKDLEIQTIVDQSENEEILYSDDQKQNYLLNKYPGLKDLKKIFNLDIP